MIMTTLIFLSAQLVRVGAALGNRGVIVVAGHHWPWRLLGLSWLWRSERRGGKYSRGDGDGDNDSDGDNDNDDDNDDDDDDSNDDDDDPIEFHPLPPRQLT